MKIRFLAMVIFGEAALSPLLANMPLIDEIAASDKAADDAVVAIRTPEELKAKQVAWRAHWLDALGEMPARTPLNARVVGRAEFDGFRLENIIFESQPGVYVTAHLALPMRPRGSAALPHGEPTREGRAPARPPYPVVLMPLGHSDAGILNPRYAAHLAMAARAGFAAFAWDPISQGERRQACDKKYDYTDNCSTEHSRLGARGWLVGWNFARFRIWDAVRAIDYVESRSDLDCSKLGIMGTSGGGTMSAYMQAFDPRIKVAFPNCYVSSLREVVGARGCHDAEQFFWNMLPNGFNHVALLAMGQPRVALATGSRWKDYFPHAGAVSTFAVFTNMTARLGFAGPYWHFHCDGPHGLPPPTRAAQVDWMRHCIDVDEAARAPLPRGPNSGKRHSCRFPVKPLVEYNALGGTGNDDPANISPLPFPASASFCTPTHQVRDQPGFRSVYALIADEAMRLAKARVPRTREELREIVRRRAGIRPLADLPAVVQKPFDHPKFGWWYLPGVFGTRRENEAAMLATLGRSVVGRDAENILIDAAARMKANGGRPVPLVAKGWDCIAAAHAYAAEPQLFSEVRFADPPPSWTEAVCNPDPTRDSYAIAVWGALKDYDWPDLVPSEAVSRAVTSDGETLPGQGVERLTDGEINPTCAWRWQKKPIRVVFDLGEAREVGGVRLTSGRSWVNCGVKTASFYGDDGKPLAEHLAFRPANTYRDNYAIWKPATCRRVTMVIEDTYDFKPNYYSGYTHAATPILPKIFETPPYPEFSGKFPTVQIAEMSFFGKEPPDDLPLPNKDGAVAYPQARLVRDWLYQSCAVSNISHLANVEPDTTKPDPMGEDLSHALRKYACGRAAARPSQLGQRASCPLQLSPTFLASRASLRREFLAAFRKDFTQFVYVKHIVMGNSIFHATDDLTDASYQEWKSVPDYTVGGSQLVLATIREDGTVSQEVLIEKPHGYIRDPNLHFDGKTLVFSMRDNLTTSNYHLFTLDLETRALKQLTFDGLVRAADMPGGSCLQRARCPLSQSGGPRSCAAADFPMPCSDIEPCWLPDGSIVFQSTRCSHSVDCWPLPVSNLFRCDADGSHIRRLGFDQVQTFFPQLMDDGRVSYTRWEYNDRSASGLQQLYAMNPDGTKQTGLFANNSEFPFSLIHTRGIPGTRDIMMISSGHHVGQKGRLAMSRLADGDDYTSFTYDPAKSVWGMNTNAVRMTFPGNRVMEIPWSPWDNPSGPATTNIPGMYYLAGAAMNAAPGVQPARQPHDYHYNVFDMHSQFGPQWAYPFPLGQGRLLVSYMPEGCRYYRGPYSSRFGVYAMDETGRRELLAFDWGQHCMQPIPVKRRTPPPRTLAKLDYREGFGTYYVQDVYAGAAMAGAPKGCVKRLRVIGLEYRPVHIGWNWQYGWHSTQGKIGTPISVGNGAYDVKHVLGEADVEADGSCSFRAPARTPLYFQLIDKDGCCIQTMRSWSTLQPGEVNGCIGCHEHPHQAGVENAKALALRRAPQRLKPWLPGGETHPFIATLEKEGPLASLDNWMGLNRPKAIVDTDQNDGFSFSRLVQPILDAKCISCHDGSGGPRSVAAAKMAAPHTGGPRSCAAACPPPSMDLRGTRGQLPPSDDQSKRKYTTSYLALTYKGQCNEKVNFAHGLGFAPFKPPYSFGAARSSVWQSLKKGHHGVALTDAELRLLACWIDLAVPFCGSYVEHHDWNDWYKQRFQYTCNKRAAFAWQELNDVRREYGLAPVPLTGFVPNIAEPRRQKYWSE